MFEIDLLPVGNNSKSGDAIALRYGYKLTPTEQTVVIVDGGDIQSGKELVKLVKNKYKQEHVDHVFLTHHHSDHSAGLSPVLTDLDVKKLWMHDFTSKEKMILEDINKRSSKNEYLLYVTESLRNITTISDIARNKRIPTQEPFAGCRIDNKITVIGPTKEFFQECLSHYKAVEADDLMMACENIFESDQKNLQDPLAIEQNPVNDSSVILLLTIDKKDILLTGDAGPIALTKALNYSSHVNNKIINRPHFLKIPHHGSIHNMGPTLLNTFIGQRPSTEGFKKFACASVAPMGRPRHPSQLIMQELTDRGYITYETAGKIASFISTNDHTDIETINKPVAR